jgi:23S rRNA pseudouridine955/2504/2580 synthase
VAKTAAAAAKLTDGFRRQRVDKLYWALVVGRPPEAQGWIDQPLAKQPGRGGERVAASAAGVPARTLYRVVARAGKVASWLALKPLTGRTHQLRAHCAMLRVPIIGDGKYGGARAHPDGAP